MTKPEFVGMLNVLSDSFRQPLSDGAYEGYWIALGELSADEMKLATKRCGTSQFAGP